VDGDRISGLVLMHRAAWTETHERVLDAFRHARFAPVASMTIFAEPRQAALPDLPTARLALGTKSILVADTICVKKHPTSA
jgi:hypothetical protein